MQGFETQNEQGERLDACSELDTSFLLEQDLQIYFWHLSVDFGAATDGSKLRSQEEPT